MNEIWKVIPDFPRYEVSNMGRIRNAKTGRIKKIHDDGAGYRILRLYISSKNRKTKRLHRIIWETFNNCKCELTVDHMDRNKDNNKLENLRCATMEQQMQNRDPIIKSNKYNLTNEIRGEIAKHLLEGTMTTWQIMKKWGPPMKYLRNVKKRGSWIKYIKK